MLILSRVFVAAIGAIAFLVLLGCVAFLFAGHAPWDTGITAGLAAIVLMLVELWELLYLRLPRLPAQPNPSYSFEKFPSQPPPVPRK